MSDKKIPLNDFCKSCGIKRYEFFRLFDRHPELRLKTAVNEKGEQVIDEKTALSIRVILRKERRENIPAKSISSAAKEINLLTAQIDELRREVFRLKAENVRLRKALNPNIRKTKNGKN